MNPHFMFNVLTNIGVQARLQGNEEVCRKLTDFSKLIQATLYRRGKDKVTIREELEYVGYYLSLQHYRFNDRLIYEQRVEDESLLKMAMPKLCLQSIVENAVIHGCEPKRGTTRLTLTVRSEGETVVMEVEDDGAGFPGAEGEIMLPLPEIRPNESHNQIGLNNVYKIIKLTYGEAYGVRVFSPNGKGCKIVIRIPFDRTVL
jgi:sensor histidine kinase YesM